MKLLDLYCGAGLAADGYRAAGFTHIVGIDNRPQPHYPYTFIQGDALAYLKDAEFLSSFDAIHASPPCQAHTRAKHLRKAQGGTSRYGDLLTPTLGHLRGIRVPWVVENVPGAPGMENAAVECGSAYGLGVRRHRLFLSDAVSLVGSGCRHKDQGRPWGVYYTPGDNIPKGGRTALNVNHGRKVMGVRRAVTWDELKEGLPPKYTRHIGQQLMNYIHAKTTYRT
jgi:DNA (cytosine-5)-methyltransferase 1